jgi:hypothetical protein
MRTRPKITSIEIIQYELTLQDVAPEPTIGIPVYKPGSVMQRRRHAIRIHSDIGVTGACSGGSAMDYAAALRLYKDSYRDGIDAIDEHGCVDVPEGPGLGVE